MEKYIVQRGSTPGWWVATDNENGMLVQFEQGHYDDTRKVTLLNCDALSSEKEAMKMATCLRGLGDWLRDNHYEKLYSLTKRQEPEPIARAYVEPDSNVEPVASSLHHGYRIECEPIEKPVTPTPQPQREPTFEELFPTYRQPEVRRKKVHTEERKPNNSVAREFDYTGGVGKIPDRPKISKAWYIWFGVVCVAVVMIAVLMVGWIGFVLIFLPLILRRR